MDRQYLVAKALDAWKSSYDERPLFHTISSAIPKSLLSPVQPMLTPIDNPASNGITDRVLPATVTSCPFAKTWYTVDDVIDVHVMTQLSTGVIGLVVSDVTKDP